MIALLRFIARWYFRLFHSVRVFNDEVLETEGPVLLVPNHVSWEDWLLLGCFLGKEWKFVVSRAVAERNWLYRKIMINRRTFPVDTESPYSVREVAEHLKKGGRLVLFAEGRISETGTLMKLFDGTGFLLHKTRAKLITGYLRGADRLPVSAEQPGWKRFFCPITIHFSEVHQAPELEGISMHAVRLKLTRWLRDRMMEHRYEVEMAKRPNHVLDAIIATARQVPRSVALEDSRRQKLTFRKLLVGAEILTRKLKRYVNPDFERVGVLLPNINATPLTLMGLWALGKVPAVLNYTSGSATMLKCIELAGLRQIVTSRKFLEQARLDPTPLLNAKLELIYLEDLKAKVGIEEKVFSWLQVRLNPAGLVRQRAAVDETAVILFTSGSEGIPKGVELTHRNLTSNVQQMLSVLDVMDSDRIFNALPLFHCFGLTVGTLLGLIRGIYVYLYPTPLHYRIVPMAIYDRQCTIFLSTNTFLNGYARKAHPYDFRSVRYLFAAAEKLQESTATTWARRFGVRVLEGYGATECSPCVSVNTPLDPQHGSVGRVMPGIDLRFEEVRGIDRGGRLQVRGPNVMKGYLNLEANGKFKALEGWYDTGDIVEQDEDGFLFVRGRMKRFAKVSGEMVSLTAVEEALSGAFPKYGMRHQVAILTRPDQRRGEALIAVSNDKRLTLKEVREVIRKKGLSNLSAPRDVQFVRDIPKLGTGKVNFRRLEEMLKEGG